jgi:uridine kinase
MHLEFVEPSKRYADLIIPEGYNPRAVATVVEMIRAQSGSLGPSIYSPS